MGFMEGMVRPAVMRMTMNKSIHYYVLNDIVMRKKGKGNYKLGINEDIQNNNVTLFFGLAGIGYELIRFTDPVFYGTVL